MEKEYILKHRNTDVAEFRIDIETENVDYVNILDNKFSPVNIKASEGGKIVSLNNWLINRCIPSSREGIERLKKEYNINDLKIIMLSKYGLSLSDHFWIDRKPFNKKWENINLFENRYSDVMGKILFDPKLKLVSDIKGSLYDPNTSTGGRLKKFWQYNEKSNLNYLIKGGSGERKQEPFNEYFASLLINSINFKCTPYHVENIGNEWVSVCPCIADKNIEMISADDVRRRYGIGKTYEALLKLGNEKVCLGFKDQLNMMIIADYLIENTDRHWDNFGILRDGETGAWISTIPLFDNGYSLWNNDFVDISKTSDSQSFEETNEDCLKYVNISKYIKKTPNIVEIFDIAFEKYENADRKNDIRKALIIKEREVMEKINSAFLNNELSIKNNFENSGTSGGIK